MFSRSKGEKVKRQLDSDGKRPKPSLSQLGLLEIPTVSDLALGGSVDDDDASLEAELLALTGGQKTQRPKKSKGVAAANLDQLVAECMNDNYEDEPIDEDDPELLAELSALGPENDEEEESNTPLQTASPDHSEEVPSPPKRPTPAIVRPSPFLAGSSVANLLKERIQMYKEAEANALAAGETSRAKRFTRGLRNMKQMLKDVNAGVAVNEEDIPPHVLTKSSRNNSAVNLSEQLTPTSSGFPCPTAPTTIPQSVAFTPDRTSAPPQLPPRQSIPNEEKESEVGVHSHHPTHVDSTIPQITPPPSPEGNFPQDPSPCPDIPSTASPNPSASESLPPASTNPPHPPPQLPSAPLSSVLARQQEYKAAALAAKKDGDREAAINFMRTAKQLDPLVQAAKEGQSVDLQSLPPPPSQALSQPLRQAPPVPSSSQQGSPPTKAPSESGSGGTVPAPPAPSAIPSNPTTILEALEQRLEKYTEQRDKAKEAGDARKERMYHRIMKQFQEAIKAHKCGRAVILEDLPTLPGFPPFPTGAPAQPPTLSPAAPGPAPTGTRPSPQKPAQNSQPRPAGTVSSTQPPVKSDVRKAPQSRVERQLSVLVRRQGQFKEAALEAKKRGEVEQAKEYLRNYKGFDQLVAATSGGLPVDMNTVPIPPQEKLGSMNTTLDFEVIDKEDCVFVPPETKADVALAFTKLEEDLIAQIKMCAHTREHFKALGDVASTNRFEQLIVHTKKDLDAVRVAFKRGDNPPRFHYENRTFTMIQCNTDLTDSDCEVTVVRGLNFNVSNPTDVDTYVKIEFPYPTDAPPQERSNVIKDTNNPEFNHKVVFSVDRKARALARVFKRHSVKCQVIAKGGWFQRDSVLGNAKVPLVPLETKCTLHESYDLVDEKKKMVGGKLEVKIRVRNPIISKQLEKVTEKWVVIDGF